MKAGGGLAPWLAFKEEALRRNATSASGLLASREARGDLRQISPQDLLQQPDDDRQQQRRNHPAHHPGLPGPGGYARDDGVLSFETAEGLLELVHPAQGLGLKRVVQPPSPRS